MKAVPPCIPQFHGHYRSPVGQPPHRPCVHSTGPCTALHCPATARHVRTSECSEGRLRGMKKEPGLRGDLHPLFRAVQGEGSDAHMFFGGIYPSIARGFLGSLTERVCLSRPPNKNNKISTHVGLISDCPAGVSSLSASLGHIGRRRVVSGHTFNTLQHVITK